MSSTQQYSEGQTDTSATSSQQTQQVSGSPKSSPKSSRKGAAGGDVGGMQSTTSGQVQIRQNFHAESEKTLNDLIQMCVRAAYKYESMAYYFDSTEVALKGFGRFFYHSATWDMDVHAEKLMKYINKRGGQITLQTIEKPPKNEWGSPLECMQVALDCEKKLNQSFLDCHALADKNGDAHLAHFLEDFFLDNQVAWIRKVGCYIAKL